MKLSFYVELLGMCVVVAGIVIEVLYRVYVGGILITCGSLVFAIGCKLYSKEKR